MSRIIRASVLGYCMGVRRAVKLAEDTLKKYADSDVYSIGPLIHNEDALAYLASLGLTVLDETALEHLCAESEHKAKKSVVIIRAHGAAPDIREKLHAAGIVIVDATCPRVLANQKKVFNCAVQKYKIIIAGDKSHGEVTALWGEAVHAGAECVIVHNEHEALVLSRSSGFAGAKTALVSQTTVSTDEYEKIRAILCGVHPDIRVFDTICPATHERQKALRELSGQVDGILVVGGKNSANTKRLFQSALRLCPYAAHIESAADIPADFFNLQTVGITAGASTPDAVIRGVENRLLKKTEMLKEA
ncbi:4-hydroxy-3-methylbut-2-enyl diphosphate reductase [Treponema sp. OMZ 840]|uniref:4-hydroxy-3-methylbut-2-enyl diphosphate reductase n=1 Tax=Treponema sp. OMZ 840 TaxID=244313 RepID=UPI003D91C5AC